MARKTETIRDVMTTSPRTHEASDTVRAAAKTMFEDDIGAVIVCDGGQVCGIVTDRDITIRAIAQDMDPTATRLGDICSKNLVTVAPDDDVQKAVAIMRDQAVRRIPVVENGTPVGIVSIGDLAIDLDADSALADISAAPPNT